MTLHNIKSMYFYKFIRFALTKKLIFFNVSITHVFHRAENTKQNKHICALSSIFYPSLLKAMS
jgi:hypothetical protein